MTVIVRLLTKQALCGLLGWKLLVLLAADSHPAGYSRPDDLSLLKLVGIPPLGFALTTLGHTPFTHT